MFYDTEGVDVSELPESFQRELLVGSVRDRRHLAADERVLPEVQEVLCRDADRMVRADLALNKGATVPAQVVLASDSDPMVAASLARREPLALEVQEVLVQHGNPAVRWRLACSLKLAPSVQLVLSRDPSERILSSLAENPVVRVSSAWPARFVRYADPDLFQQVVEGCDVEVVEGLVENWEGSLDELVTAAGLVSR